MGIWQRVGRALRLLESPSVIEDASQVKQVSIHVEETGSSGIQNFSGYYSEEYLSTLRGTKAADIWDQMRRSDPKIKMVLSAVKNPIKGAHWAIQPGADGEEFKRHADLMEQILFKDLHQGWTQQIAETLTFLEFGFATFEVIHKVVTNHPDFGSYNSLDKIAWRSPRTIERWNLDPNGRLMSISQYAFGDLQRLVDIPGSFLLTFTHEKEGDNYEGVSALRPCYGPWFRKNAYLKLMAIGMEKFAIPTPYMEVPEGKENSTEYFNAKKVLEKYAAHQQQFIMFPAGWKLGFAQSNFDASKIRDAINEENAEMAYAFLENFLELGHSGNSGSYALGTDLSDFFLMGLEHTANYICEVYNRVLIPDMIKLNFGPQTHYPQLEATGITDKPGKEFAEVIKLLADSKTITPDTDLEDDLREKFGLPRKMAAVIPTVAPAPAPQLSLVNPIRFADTPKTPKALITQKTDELQALMQAILRDMGSRVISDLMAKKKRSNPSQYLAITQQVTPKGSQDYKAQLRNFLAGVSNDAITMVRKEIPGGSKIKLVESLRLASNEDYYKKLPASLQKAIDAQIGLLSAFQIQDLLKALYFQFNSSVDSTDSDIQLEADLQGSMDRFLEGSSLATGAGNTVAKVVNEGRSEFFFDPDVSAQIESFTFTNGDPVSPICQDLAGTVFSKDDPNLDRYSPPLHHNCKSFLVANLNGSGKEIDPDGLTPSKGLEQYITLADVSAQIMGGAFALAYIDISKQTAMNEQDAKNLAVQVTALDPNQSIQQGDLAYRISLKDIALFEDGTLKSFEPMPGVTVYYGRLRAVQGAL